MQHHGMSLKAALKIARIMAFKCQRDSYLQQFRSTVVSCKPAKLGERAGYEAVLRDTILFPGGGGQVNKFHRGFCRSN